MSAKTLCPIRDIKGINKYQYSSYARDIFSRPSVSDVLHNTTRKQKFFEILQKNTGKEGHLTKEKMMKTLGEFRHELDPDQFYRLSRAILPEEKQRFSLTSQNIQISKSKEDLSDDQRGAGKQEQAVGFDENIRPRKDNTVPTKPDTNLCRTIRNKEKTGNKNEKEKNKKDSSFFHFTQTTLRNRDN